MSSHPMNKWKLTLILISFLSTLVMASAGAMIFNFNDDIKTGLANKKFLPPTEYFARPDEIPTAESHTRDQIKKLFQSRNYQEREWTDSLRNGEFQEATGDACIERLTEKGYQFPTSTAESSSGHPVPTDSDLNFSTSDQGSGPSTNTSGGTGSSPSPHEQIFGPERVSSCFDFKTQTTKDPLFAEFQSQIIAFDHDGNVSATFQIGNSTHLSSVALLEPVLIAQYLDGKPLMQRYRELGQIPTQCLNAVLAIEDPKFLEHSGVSVTGLARALLANLGGGKIKQGGSTITQQMVKNYFLTSEKTFKRKLKEIVMSVLLESHASKDEILETYLNIIYLGQNGPFQVRGFGAASEFYFSKPLEELELPDCALLAAILNSPGLFDPFSKPENALKRRARVLEKMVEHQFISQEEMTKAQSAPLPQDRKLAISETAPYYIDAVNKEAKKKGLEIEGTSIFTGLSLKEQKAAQDAVQAGLQEIETKNPKILANKQKNMILEGALLSANNLNGEITAIVGGRGYRLTQFNRAVDGHRQIGSIMKPFVYLAALNNPGTENWNPLSVVNDQKTTFKYGKQSWTPDNYGKKYYGEVPLYFALKNSLNASTAVVGMSVGLPKVIQTARNLGVTSPLEEVPSALLGSFELFPLEVLESYAS